MDREGDQIACIKEQGTASRKNEGGQIGESEQRENRITKIVCYKERDVATQGEDNAGKGRSTRVTKNGEIGRAHV